MSFINLYLLPIFIIFLVFLVILFLLNIIWTKRLFKGVNNEFFVKVFPLSIFNYRLKLFLHILAIVLILIALLRPVIMKKSGSENVFKMDIVIALDISPSMLARDVLPNRLERAKNEIIGLLGRIPDYRIALTLFSGRAILQIPLTTDHSALQLLLPSINTDYISNRGTNISEALRVSLTALDSSPKTFKKVVLLLTDGEDHSPDVQEVLKQYKAGGIVLYTVGIGSETGAPIPITDGSGNVADYMKDSKGSPVVSKLDLNYLNMLAGYTGGKMFIANDSNFNLSNFVNTISGIEKSKSKVASTGKEFDDIFRYFLFPALIIMLVAIIIPNKRIKLFSSSIMLFLLILNSSAAYTENLNFGEWQNNMVGNYLYNSKKYNESLGSYTRNSGLSNYKNNYNMGNTLYLLGRQEEAQREWQSVLSKKSSSRLDKSQTYFNMGVSAASNEDYGVAVQNFIETLKNNPKDLDAKKNLELVLGMVKKKQQEKKQKGKGKEDDSKGKDNLSKGNESQGKSRAENKRYTKEDASNILNNYNDLKPFNPLKPKDEKQDEKDW